MSQIIWLEPLLTDPGRIQREAAVRKKDYSEKTVAKSEAEAYLLDGWEMSRELKRTIKLRKYRPHDEVLENRFWYLCYLLGYSALNSGRKFRVRIQRKDAEPLMKQIDVLAKDDETVIVAECKSSEKMTRRSLQKDVEEFSNLKGPIASAIRNHFGNDFKPKVVWLFVTDNVIWSSADRERAKGSGIQIITERELRYYLQIAEHLRSAARFQFLAEFLGGQKIPELENVKVPAIRGKLGGKRFYSFVTTPRHLLKIAFVNHRALNDPAGAPSYQRLISRARLAQIGRFIKAKGFFPTNLLVNFVSKIRFEKVANSDEQDIVFGNLYLPASYRSAWVIDGQHRLYGYAPLADEYLDQHVMVVAFEELRKEEEANLFVTINHEQKSVPKTLLDDLEGELKWGSEKPNERIGAIAARLISLINDDFGGPFYGRVARQGIPPSEKTCLTIPALKDGLKRSKLIGDLILNSKEFAPGPLSGISDAESLDRARSAVNAFFTIIADANPSLWDLGRLGLLCTNVAIQAFLRLFGSLVRQFESESGLRARELEPNEIIEGVQNYLDPVVLWLQSANSEDMEREGARYCQKWCMTGFKRRSWF